MITNQIRPIEIKEIVVSERNVRTEDRNVQIKELGESIKEFGLLQPIVLKGEYGKPPYELLIGQRRFLAHKDYLRVETIQAVFIQLDSELDELIISLAENIQRVELNYAEKSKAITLLYEKFSGNYKAVADKLGVSEPSIREYVNVEEQLTDKARKLWENKKVTKEDLKRVIKASQGDKGKLDELIDEMAEMNKYEQERVVRVSQKEPGLSTKEKLEKAKKTPIEYNVVLNLSQELQDALMIATKELEIEKESVALLALTEWLNNNGFTRKVGG